MCIRDRPPTDLLATRALCQEILRWAGEGHKLLIHCIGGWGRSGTIAAALLVHEGHSPGEAITLVRRARSPRCIESVSQERFVAEYAAAHTQLRRFFVVLTPEQLAERLGGEPGNRRLRRGSRPALALLSASSLRSEIARHIDPSPLYILSGEALPEQLDSGLDLSLDRAYGQKSKSWQALRFGELVTAAAALSLIHISEPTRPY